MNDHSTVVNRTARISDAGHGGQIVCSEKVFLGLKEAQATGLFK